MERRLGPWENFLGPFCIENAIWLLGFFFGVVVVVFSERENMVATLCIPS